MVDPEQMIAQAKTGPEDALGLLLDLYRNYLRPPVESVMKVELERILAILTPAQHKLWQDLIGAPFQGSRRMPPPGMFGPPGRFGPPPGGKRSLDS